MTTAQQSRREAMAKRLQESIAGKGARWGMTHPSRAEELLAAADFILAEQGRREGPLVKMLEHAQSCGLYGSSCMDMIKHTLAAYHALDAPPQRTVEEIAADVVELRPGREFSDMPDMLATFKRLDALTDELAAALKRAEGERNAEGVKRGKE